MKIQDLFRRYSLKRNASQEPTGLLPIGSVRSAVAFIDVQDTSFDRCKQALMNFFRERGIKFDIFFFDFRKLTQGERLITSITTTVLKKDLNWYGKPSQEKMKLMLEGEPDLFLSLLPENSFPLEYMARCSRARFKVGRQQLPGGVFDLVVLDPAGQKLSEEEAFHSILTYLERIQ